MSKYIDADKLKEDLSVLIEHNRGMIFGWLANAIDDTIDAQPTIEAEPVKHGRWKHYLKEGLKWECAECGSRFATPWHYCPNCGADMRPQEEVHYIPVPEWLRGEVEE